MRTIKTTDAIELISNQEDIEFLQSTDMETVTEEEVREYCSAETYRDLFASNNKALAELSINDPNDNHDEDIETMTTTTTTTEDTTMTTDTNTSTTETLTYCGVEFVCEFKEDKAFAGKTITTEDFGSLSKDMLQQIVTWQATHISAQDTRTVQQQVERQEQRVQQQPQDHTIARQELKKALWSAFSTGQREWLSVVVNGEKRGSQLTFEEIEVGRYKIRFGDLPTNSKATISKVIAELCRTQNWYCKVQSTTINGTSVVKHVYVNMKLN